MAITIDLDRSGNSLNVLVGAEETPAYILWITVNHDGNKQYYYPEQFAVGGPYVYPGLMQSKVSLGIGSGPVEVTVYGISTNDIQTATA